MHTTHLRSAIVTAISILVVSIVVAIVFGTDLKQVRSGAGDNLSGFVWSETIGWISMNSTGKPGATTDYGVDVDASGNISGMAWSENIGWISFDESDGTHPSATFDKSTGEVSGWARALSAPAAGGNAGGWDGWISLKGANYGVTVSACNWSGWAWGSDVVGWVNFSGNGGTVTGSGDACESVAASCTGTAPSSLGRNMCAGEPSISTPYTYVATCGAPTSKCLFTCDLGYTYNGSGDCRETECNDGSDNDLDTLTDGADLGCLDPVTGTHNINDDSETLITSDPDITARPRVVSQGDSTTLEWTTGGTPETSCTFTANGVSIVAAAFAADTNPIGGSYTTAVDARTTYILTCGGLSDSVMVEVQGYGTET